MKAKSRKSPSVQDKAIAAYLKDVQHEQESQILVAKKIESVIKGRSLIWKFSVENLVGITLGSLTFKFEWDGYNPPCRLRNEKWGVKDQWTAPLISITDLDCNMTQIEEKNKKCEEDLMDGVRFDVSVTFDGPLNNVPYRNWLEVYADGTYKYGPK